jgi:hypothetical protein
VAEPEVAYHSQHPADVNRTTCGVSGVEQSTLDLVERVGVVKPRGDSRGAAPSVLSFAVPVTFGDAATGAERESRGDKRDGFASRDGSQLREVAAACSELVIGAILSQPANDEQLFAP